MTVNLESVSVMAKEDVSAEIVRLKIEVMDVKELDKHIVEYEAKIMRLNQALLNPEISEEKRQILLDKIDNRTKAYFAMTEHRKVVE